MASDAINDVGLYGMAAAVPKTSISNLKFDAVYSLVVLVSDYHGGVRL